jgi:signal recognition particle GTPase
VIEERVDISTGWSYGGERERAHGLKGGKEMVVVMIGVAGKGKSLTTAMSASVVCKVNKH